MNGVGLIIDLSEGWMYVAVVIDLYSRQVVGWAIDEHMKTSLCINALQMAYWRKKPAKGLLHHSDRGSQYEALLSRTANSHGYNSKHDMSRKGNCWNNWPTERFFRSLKYEHLNYQRFTRKAQAKLSIIDYSAFYHGQRIHSILGYKTLLAFEREFYYKIA